MPTPPAGRRDLIQVRRDVAADWESVNPVLAAGEPGFDTTNDVLKIGDGVTAWVDLPGFEAGSGGGGAVDSVNGATGTVVLTADDIDDTSTTNKFATAEELSKLDGVELGATADQSAAEILAALLTVDGSGSELDADTLDGNEAADFAAAEHDHASDYVALTTLSTAGKGVVEHGATAGTARPSGFASIEWIGSVEPTNAVDGDTWIDTA